MSNKLIDNSCDDLKMVNNLREFIKDPGIQIIRIATGYWDIPGLALVADKLKEFLERDGTRLLLLIGKDPYVYANQMKEAKYKDMNYPEDFIRTDLEELEIKSEFEDAIKLLLDYCTDSDDSKIQIRIFRKNEKDETQFLHSKCYIFDGGLDKDKGIGIIGSSNFTKKGLEDNAELNYLEGDAVHVLRQEVIINRKSHLQWFNEKWEISDKWNKTFLEQILRPAPITKTVKEKSEKAANLPFTPYELYIKLLQIKFGNIVDRNLNSQLQTWLPKNVKQLDYQLDAVKRCVAIMHEHGGFMLADVVGLGKTIVATLIIKQFLSMREDDGREGRVLVITPPAIQSGWKKTIKDFDEQADEKITPLVDFLTTGRITGFIDDDTDGLLDEEGDSEEFGENLEAKNYGLIIIDESHKFRNSGTQMYQALDNLISQIWSETGVYPYIGLLSATPQNNRPNDLKNQIYLFERNHTDSTLRKAESGNLEKFFSDVNKEYSELISRGNSDEIIIDETERERRLAALSNKIHDCILSDILERRTRTDVEKYYAKDMEAQGITFPEISGPHVLEYKMDDELAELFSDTMKIIAPDDEDKKTDNYLHYYRYRAIEYFVDAAEEEKRRGRGNRNVQDVANQLANIMQILLVKRLESSFTAFNQSLLNLKRYTENMIRMWENDTIFVCPQIDVNKELDTEAKNKSFEECLNDIRKKIERLTADGRNERGQNAEYRCKDFRSEYIKLIKKDRDILARLCDRWARNSEDPKLDTFKDSLKSVLFNPQTNTSGKLVIFSEAKDTVDALKRAVKYKGYKPLVIAAENRDREEKTIAENFDANYTGEWKDDYNVLITTEVLAEGVNLHRANVILNYDTPWNSTRLMQRIGRVNRIGSQAKYIYVYNFFPSAQGDQQIKLVRKAHTKLQSFHALFGEDSKIFSDKEILVPHNLPTIINDEESPMQKYIYELRQYRDDHPERYEKIMNTDSGWEIASSSDGTAYFLVGSQRGGRLSIEVNHDETKVVSDMTLLERLSVSKDTSSVPLPENWGQRRKGAIIAFQQYFVRINRAKTGDRQTKANGVIVQLYRTENLSASAKQTLKQARQLVNKNNPDIIRKMLAIGKVLNATSPQLFNLDAGEVEQILADNIQHVVEQTAVRQGEPQIILATIK